LIPFTSLKLSRKIRARRKTMTGKREIQFACLELYDKGSEFKKWKIGILEYWNTGILEY